MIGLLNAYHFEEDAQYQLEYTSMCMNYLRGVFTAEGVTKFDVALGENPKSADQCDAWIITGSPKGAYDQDPWILRLGEFVREVHKQKRKMIGICFGHQLIAQYLGGKTEKSKNGWGVGVQTFRILQSKPWMQPELKDVSLLFSHQDQVVKLPPGAGLLAESQSCPVQMFSIGQHIFSLQGHPEFTAAFAKGRMDSRIPLIGQSKYDQAVKTIGSPTNSVELGRWMSWFFSGPVK